MQGSLFGHCLLTGYQFLESSLPSLDTLGEAGPSQLDFETKLQGQINGARRLRRVRSAPLQNADQSPPPELWEAQVPCTTRCNLVACSHY